MSHNNALHFTLAGSKFTLSHLMAITCEVQDVRRVIKEIKILEKDNLEAVPSPSTSDTSGKATNPNWNLLREILKQCHEVDAVHYMGPLHDGIT